MPSRWSEAPVCDADSSLEPDPTTTPTVAPWHTQTHTNDQEEGEVCPNHGNSFGKNHSSILISRWTCCRPLMFGMVRRATQQTDKQRRPRVVPDCARLVEGTHVAQVPHVVVSALALGELPSATYVGLNTS